VRRKPYTEIGIRRVPCARCGKPSAFQWNICALGKRFNGLCADCDVALNAMVLRWIRWPQAGRIICAYRQKVSRP
jgi:hypothetical protein